MRFCGGVRRHPGNAADAAATAACTSSRPASATVASTSAVAGLKTSTDSVELPVRHSPPTQFNAPTPMSVLLMVTENSRVSPEFESIHYGGSSQLRVA